MNDEVHVVEVFPRDGLQTLVDGARLPGTAEKIEIIRALAAAGLKEIECTSFTHPRRVPNLADATDVMSALRELEDVTLRALVPNVRGAERAVGAGVRKLSCLVVASETYQGLNAGMSIEANLEEISRIAQLCQDIGIDVHCGVGVAFVCPYEGEIPEDNVTRVIEALVNVGIADLTIADSVGLAGPELVAARASHIMERWPQIDLALHLHTLGGMAMASVYAAYKAGVRRFESAVTGMGAGISMPIPAREMGNIATEDLIFLFDALDVPVAVDRDLLQAAMTMIADALGVPPQSYVSRFGSTAEFHEQARRHLARARH